MDIAHEIAERFYRRAQQDPTLHPFFPGSLRCATESLGAYLTQLLGGANEYSEMRWEFSLRQAHHRFKIGPKERDAWLRVMDTTLDEVELDSSTREALRSFFAGYANHMVAPSGCPVDTMNGSAIGARANEYIGVEQAVETIRRGDVEKTLELVAELRSCFERDPAAHLGVLALMSGSETPAFVEYVLKTLRENADLAKSRYARGQTLLHGVAAAGSLPVVELLLSQGADPNTRDEAGHGPLYSVANECGKKSGASIVRALIHAGADPNAGDGATRCTALHMAARRGHVEIAAALIDCGARIDVPDRKGMTPLRRALNCSKRNVAELLISRGATA